MKYCSTRGGVQGASFADCILSGYAPDGGLFVPESLPQIDQEQLRHWRELDFASLAYCIFELFVGDEIRAADLRRLTDSFYAGFESDEIVPVKRVGSFFVAELFHGPTYCFKDLGQQPLVGFLAHFAKQRGERRTMLVATTGDTGPAAIRAVNDVAGEALDIIVFYPDGQISDLQRKQMTTCISQRCRVVAFEGGGDDMDAPLKRLAGDLEFAKKYGLVGINSYNFGRPLAQLVQYFWTYFRVIDTIDLEFGSPIDVVVPCGALGNLTAAFMAKHMGLPLRRLVAGTNANDITHRTITTGKFHRADVMEKTMSEAINIQVPYNMERIFYYLTGENKSLIASWMSEMDTTGKLTLPQDWHAKLQEVFSSCRIDDAAMCAALKRGVEHYDYLADPHTAVALAAAWDAYGNTGHASHEPEVPVAVISTASPCKFEDAVTKAAGDLKWGAYVGSAAFPQSARALLAQSERPIGKFSSRGSLAASQAAWEAEVRAMLSSASDASPALPRARL